MTDQACTPDPDLVRTLTAKVIDDAISELRDTGVLDISEICEGELDGLDFDQQDAVIRAVRDALRDTRFGYTIPGGPSTALDDAAIYLYTHGRTDLAAAVQYSADHQVATATVWTDPRTGRQYPLDAPLLDCESVDPAHDVWVLSGWLLPIGDEPTPVLSYQGDRDPLNRHRTIIDIIDRYGPLTPASAFTEGGGGA